MAEIKSGEREVDTGGEEDVGVQSELVGWLLGKEMGLGLKGEKNV